MRENNRKDLNVTSWLDRLILFCLKRKVIVGVLVIVLVAWGILVAPFDWQLWGIPRDPVPADAIPDIGENQQIVFTEWMGRSPQDVEDQITYPLTVSLMGIPGVKTVRSLSMFGFSSIYVIFEEDIEFYWSRSRILEKLSSLPTGLLPEGVRPALGPDATALGQIFWYTLEGRDSEGNPTGGWDLNELRSTQDWYVRYGLLSAEGVSEVASVGGFVQEYQIDVDPDKLRIYDVTLDQVVAAARMSNLDVGARTIEINKVEYVIRGIGFVKTIEDIRNSVIKANDNIPVYIKNVAHVSLGPALRRGALDKEGAEVVGGVVVVRYGENPLAAINSVKEKIEEIAPGLPKKTLPDGTVSQVTIVPFYDRTGLIYETLGTLNTALVQEILITIIVVLVLLMHLRSSVLVSLMLPLAVLMCFIAMRVFGVDANIVALSGIAIAIGTIVDMGIVMTENILNRLKQASEDEDRLAVVYKASREVGSAVLTAVATTIVGFLPVFTMQAAEGKLFRPLAFTKTFALLASIIIALTLIPPLAHLLLRAGRKGRGARNTGRYVGAGTLVAAGVLAFVYVSWWTGAILFLLGLYLAFQDLMPENVRQASGWIVNGALVLIVVLLLADNWMPLGIEKGFAFNLIFTAGVIACGLFLVFLFIRFYPSLLRWCLDHKTLFLCLPIVLVFFGLLAWLGFGTLFGWLPQSIRTAGPVSSFAHLFPGLGEEFMPPLDEGSFLWMPTTMPHASIGEAMDVLQKQDMAIRQIPEVDSVVGKIGRAETPLDPAPVSMIETIINYTSEYLTDKDGKRLTFRYDPDEVDFFRNVEGKPVPADDGEPYKVRGTFERDEQGNLIPDEDGVPFRLWRPQLNPDLNPDRKSWPGIEDPDDIWDAIVDAAQMPGTTSAPKLQPISARLVMLQSGIRAPMGIRIKGPDLETIEQVALRLEGLVKQVPSVKPQTVFAERIVGKPYLEIQIDRKAIARYGVHVRNIQNIIETAIGGNIVTKTVEGRERYPVRVRYLRELRDSIEDLKRTLVPSSDGTQVPLSQLARIEYVRGPQVIKSEDTFLVGYVLFDKREGYAEIDVVEQVRDFLLDQRETGNLELPPGVSYSFAGNYENQVRAEKRLAIVLPLALIIIFLILYLQFDSISTTGFVFSGIIVAWAGGFILLWLYGQPWFLDLSVFGVNMRELFQVHPINLSVAIWVGFLALFGIASDDGVVVATYLEQSFERRTTENRDEIRKATVAAGKRRIRPCMMTTATTLLALLPVLTSKGRGSDIMVPMALPVFGGMLVEVITILTVPVLYALWKEMGLRKEK